MDDNLLNVRFTFRSFINAFVEPEATMFKPKIGISSFLLLAICLILLFVAIYERNRANEIEAISVTVSNREYRDLVSRDLRLTKREREFQKIARGFERPFDMAYLDLAGRAELANLRNSKLKLIREREILNAIRFDLARKLED